MQVVHRTGSNVLFDRTDEPGTGAPKPGH
eukprot:COSAG03_NODE_20651_length_316_cov_0.557604_1_plen_28_part_01